MSRLSDQWEDEDRYLRLVRITSFFNVAPEWSWTDYVRPRGDCGIHRRRVRTATVQKRRLANKAARKARRITRYP